MTVSTGAAAPIAEWKDYINKVTFIKPGQFQMISGSVCSDGIRVIFNIVLRLPAGTGLTYSDKIMKFPVEVRPPTTLYFPTNTTVLETATGASATSRFHGGHIAIITDGIAGNGFVCSAAENTHGMNIFMSGEYLLKSPPKV